MSLNHNNAHDRWVQGYSHFLLFFVIFSFILTYSIVLGVGWGAIVAMIAHRISVFLHAGATSAPTLTVMITEAAWLFIAALMVQALTAIAYDRETGYRLRSKAGIFAGRTVCLLLMITAGFVAIRPFVDLV